MRHTTITKIDVYKRQIPVRIGSHNQSTKALESENEKLKKLLGEKDLEIAILKDLVKKTNPQFKIK